MAAGTVHKRSQRRIAVVTTLALGLGLLGLSFRLPAQATIGSVPNQSSFNAEDKTVDTTGAGRQVFELRDEASGPKDNSFSGGGPKEDDPCPTADPDHAAPQNADLTKSWFGTDTARPGTLYLAWARKAAQGTVTIDFELNQNTTACSATGVNPTRTLDDILVTYDFQGGNTIAIETRRWNGTKWDQRLVLDEDISDKSISKDESFGELAIDLFAARILDSSPSASCISLATGFAKTRTGGGGAFETSTVKDFILPTEIIRVSNCGSLTIEKDARPDSAENFAFTTTGSGLSNFELDDDADPVLSNAVTFESRDTVSVTEIAAAGWSLTDISCTGPGASKVEVGGDGDFDSGDTTVRVALAAGDDITCVYVNSRPSSITITKDARPDNGRDFSFSSTGRLGSGGSFVLDDGTATSPSPSDTSAPSSVTFSNVPPGAYSFTEATATGWALSAINCGAKTVVKDLATRTVSFSIVPGEVVACMFVNDKTPPSIEVTKDANPTSVSEPGGLVEYTVGVINNSPLPMTIADLADSIFGDVTVVASPITATTCAVGTVLAAANPNNDTDRYTCTFTAFVAGNTATAPSHTNIVSATGVDSDGVPVSDTDDAVVVITDVVPQIQVTKAASKTTVHSGDPVTYTYEVRNPGVEPLTVTLVDDRCVSITGPAADSGVTGKLDAGEVWTFSCVQTLTTTTTNVVTATGTDDEGNKATATATATVVVINPAIAIDKTASAASVQPGTTVVYTYTVTNPGDVPLSAVTVSDDKCSPVTFVRGDVNLDKLLQVGETWEFECSQVQTGSRDTLTNVGTATGVDTLGQKVTSTDTVTISVVAPSVIVRPAPEVAIAPAALSAPAAAPAVVAAPVTLPRTGTDAKGLLQLAGSLILLGLALMLTVGPVSRLRRP